MFLIIIFNKKYKKNLYILDVDYMLKYIELGLFWSFFI